MSIKRTLWDFLDNSPAPPAVVDSTDEDVEGVYFEQARTQTRWRVGITAALALGGLLVLIAIGGYFVSSMNTPAIVLPEPDSSGVDMAGNPQPGGDRPTSQVTVHVVGAVVKPGVVILDAPSRVQDALEAAGGALPEAELSGVNLARELFDGEQIVVPAQGEDREITGGLSGGLVSLSRASSAELQELPRVGPHTAERIIDWRETHGPFRSVEDLLAVSGIGPATLEGLRDLVTP